MVDAARQMLDELMGRNRNLHPSEAPRKVNWEDPEFCQYYNVKFCPHDLFVNTRADLGPCTRIHDEEAKRMYEEAKLTIRKRHYEDEFLRFCNTMLNDVDRKIQKGKQRLQLMNRDRPAGGQLSKYQEQLNNLEARIKKLLSEAEEAGIRGDVDQAQDLMIHCEQLREERDAFVAQNESANNSINKALADAEKLIEQNERSPKSSSERIEKEKSPPHIEENTTDSTSATTNVTDPNGKNNTLSWMVDGVGSMNEKQMEVCETCGAFLIVGDAQQRIEDHLMGKQHLGYSKLRKAVADIYERRQKEREDEDRRRPDERTPRSCEPERKRDYQRDRDYRGRSREQSRRRSSERTRHYSSRSHHGRRSHSRSRSHHYRHSSRDRRDRSRSRSRSRY